MSKNNNVNANVDNKVDAEVDGVKVDAKINDAGENPAPASTQAEEKKPGKVRTFGKKVWSGIKKYGPMALEGVVTILTIGAITKNAMGIRQLDSRLDGLEGRLDLPGDDLLGDAGGVDAGDLGSDASTAD